MLAPGALIDLRPIVEILQGLRPQAVKLAPALASPAHQARLPQDLQVLGDGRKREFEPVDEFLHRALACREEVQKPSPIWIDDRMKDLLARLEHDIDYSVVST
jgi:hypothetical protein